MTVGRPDFDAPAFIRAHTALQAPKFVPEIELYLASEVTPLWQMTEKEFGVTNSPPPFWAFAWPGGQGLARYILDNPDVVRGQRVLDFACGCGIASIAAHKAGSIRVMASDIDPLARAALQLNALHNGVFVEDIGVINLEKPFKGADIICAGDVCYQQTMSASVTRWLRLCAEAGVLVLIADPGRAWVPEQGLIERTSFQVPTSRELEDSDSRTVLVWEMRGLE
ncbi:MAG: 50S ribosomal protein L11 methyltransferase [Pseudomonadota bacterium]|nr:50S ribosomal protein L11 methyltransferase [Pseudomonadota bacterium]